MRVTTKGQVTIPAIIREKLGIVPHSNVEFRVERDRVFLEKSRLRATYNRFRQFRGIATVKMTTEEIMALTRGR